MNTCYTVLFDSSHPAELFSFGFLDELSVHLRRPSLARSPGGLDLKRLATALINSPD